MDTFSLLQRMFIYLKCARLEMSFLKLN